MIRETHYDHLFESQKQFRLLLDCMSKPGLVANLDSPIKVPDGLNKASALVGFALLNGDVTFCATVNEEHLNSYFIVNTLAKPADADQVDFIFLNGEQPDLAVLNAAKTGLPEYPENGASIVIDVQSISTDTIEGGTELTLEGPGVDGQKTVYLQGLSASLLDALQELNIEYPLGVDTFFTDKNGTVMCLPRSNKFKFQEV